MNRTAKEYQNQCDNCKHCNAIHGACNLQKLIDYMSGQLSCSYEKLKKKWVQNSPIMKERTEEIIAKETELINFMKQLNTLSA